MSTVPADVNYTFSPVEIEALKDYGTIISHEAGELLVDEGTTRQDLLVTLSGETHIFVETPEGSKRLGWMEPGQFTGDISVITGSASLVRVEMGKAGTCSIFRLSNCKRFWSRILLCLTSSCKH